MNQLKPMLKNPLLKIAVSPFIVLLLHTIATVTGLYDNYWWADVFFHFIGGISIALSANFLLEDFSGNQKFHTQFKPLRVLILISLVALAAVSWELVEFTADTFLHTRFQPDNFDTMKDLLMGLSGGSLTAFIITLRKRK